MAKNKNKLNQKQNKKSTPNQENFLPKTKKKTRPEKQFEQKQKCGFDRCLLCVRSMICFVLVDLLPEEGGGVKKVFRFSDFGRFLIPNWSIFGSKLIQNWLNIEVKMDDAPEWVMERVLGGFQRVWGEKCNMSYVNKTLIFLAWKSVYWLLWKTGWNLLALIEAIW